MTWKKFLKVIWRKMVERVCIQQFDFKLIISLFQVKIVMKFLHSCRWAGNAFPTKVRMRHLGSQYFSWKNTHLRCRSLHQSNCDPIIGPWRVYDMLKFPWSWDKELACREPRGFGFVQFLEQADAEEAQYYMNHQVLFGREITVVFAQENRKKPAEMRVKERHRW